jgi:hypothetical protein
MALRRRSRLAVIGLALCGGVIALVAVGRWWLFRMPERAARKAIAAATGRVLVSSDSVYRLTFGPFTYEPATRSLTFEWVRLDTDTARNARREEPLPTASASLRGGRVLGIGLPALIGPRKTLSIGAIRVDEINVRLSSAVSERRAGAGVESRGPGGAEPPIAPTARPAEAGSALEWWPKVALPGAAPRIRIERIELPRVAVALDSEPGLAHRLLSMSVQIDDIVAGPHSPRGTPVRIGNVRLRAERYSGIWDSLTSVVVAQVEANAADSILRLDSVEVRPTLDLAEQRRRNRWRRTRIGASIAAITARGVDYGAILRSGTIAIRAVDLATPRVDMLVDRKPQPDPRPEPARMPHQIMRALPVRVAIDTIRAGGGTIVYGELEPWRRRPGIVTFEEVHGSITNLSNDPRRMSDAHPMVMTASAKLMGSGHLSTELEIPLLADRFRMRYRGTLGRMPMVDFNRFIAVNTPAKVRQGEALGLAFDARIVDGHATGRLIPRYRDFKIGVNKKGGGLLASIGRHIGSFFFNNFKLRRDNPEDDGKGRLVVARIDLQKAPADELFPFLWSTLREGLRQVMTR